MVPRSRLVLLLAALVASGCGSPTPSLTLPDAAPGDWPVAAPEEVGLDAARLGALLQRIRAGSLGRLHALLVVRHGRLAVEEYFPPSSREDVHTVQSVTKSVTSLLVGLALDAGALASVDAPVLGFFPEYPELKGVDPRRDALRLRDLLAMRGGLAWTEDPYPGSDLEALNRSSGDWVRFVLDRPMAEPPGTTWQYDSGGVIAVAGALRSATRMSPDEFAHQRLFEPLGIAGERWFRSPYDGLPHAGGGLFLRARDMAKLGQLVLEGGNFAGRRVVSESWLAESTRRVTGPLSFFPRPVYYGLLWWLFPFDGRAADSPTQPDIVTASGAGGQWIFVVRSLDLVVTFTADQANPQFFRPVDILYEDILPALRG